MRLLTSRDPDGLTLLYSGLSIDDLHRRFFAVYHTPRRFFEHLAAASTEGGFALVAVLDDPVECIVAEADFFLLDNGNGELAITVAADWRGWLGPYLLDALIEAAAARGVPNLEAEILVENGRMLALIRGRGYATVDGSDFTTVRVSVGTATLTPTWAGPHDRPRVLAEVAAGGERSVPFGKQACR